MAAKIVFPETLLSSEQGELHPSVIRFKIYDKDNTSNEAEILLPVPIALTNSYAMQFDDLEAGFLGRTIEEINELYQGDQGFGDAAADVATGALATIGSVSDQVRRVGGFSLNKSGQLTINRPANRSFSFRFNLVPKSEKEAKNIQKIIDVFKYAMYPPVPSSGDKYVYLNPARFVIDFLYNPGLQENRKLFRSYFCFLTGLDIDQHSAGAPSYYAGGYPQNRSFGLNFQELSPLNRQNIQDLEPPGDVGSVGGRAAENIIQGTRVLDLTELADRVPTVGTGVTNITDGPRAGEQ